MGKSKRKHSRNSFWRHPYHPITDLDNPSWFQVIESESEITQFSSVQLSRSVMSTLLPHELQHARPPCPSPTPGVHSDSCPSSWWCHPAILSSVVPFSSCPQSLPASESFPMSQLLAWGGQSIGVSALAWVLPMNTHDWSPLEWTGCFSLEWCKCSRVSSCKTCKCKKPLNCSY